MQFRPQLVGIITLGMIASAVAALRTVDGAAKPEAPPVAHATAARQPELHRALGLLLYVYGDYSVAVGDDGVILDENEYLEQHQILDEVELILQRVDRTDIEQTRSVAAALQRDLESVRDAVSERRLPATVRAEVRRLRDAIVVKHGLDLAPSRVPRLERGQALFQQACGACHGSDGRARTALALTLTPPPIDFRAARLSETLSPYQVFNIVTFGIPGTAMPSFEVLDEDERWDLAFQVMSMRHDPVAGAPTRLAQTGSLARGLPSLSQLATLTDAELGDWFVARGVSAKDKASAVARARRLQLQP
jgi:high-affinity iron transporter